MKTLKLKKEICDYLIKNRWQFLIVFLSLILGIIIGTVFFVSMDLQTSGAMDEYIKNFVSAYSLQSIDRSNVFKFSVYNNIKTTLIVWVSGLWVGLIPLSLLQIGAKGYKLGFSTALFVKGFGLKGGLFAVFSTIPQVFVAIPALMVYSIFNINFTLSRHRLRLKNSSTHIRNEIYTKNLIYLVGLIILSFFVAFLDAYVIPLILKPICSILGK